MKKHLMMNITALLSTFALCSIATVLVSTNSNGVSLSYALESPVQNTENDNYGQVDFQQEKDFDIYTDFVYDESKYFNPDEVNLDVVSVRKFNNVDDFTLSNDELIKMELANLNNSKNLADSSMYKRETQSTKDDREDIDDLEIEIIKLEEYEVEVEPEVEIQVIVEPVVVPEVVVELPEGYQEKFAKWYSANSDIQGWLKLNGTKLDYPIMQTTNDYYYLNRNLYKESDVWGIPYMSSYCTTDVSTNTILFGHSRDTTGEQLSTLKNYRNVEFYKQNPIIEFDSVYADGDYKIIAYFIENTDEANQFFRYHEFVNQTDESYINNFIEQAKLRSYINTTVDYLPTDKFLTISTCEDTNTSNYNRLVLVARKVREGELSSVDTTNATQNSIQLLPIK